MCVLSFAILVGKYSLINIYKMDGAASVKGQFQEKKREKMWE